MRLNFCRVIVAVFLHTFLFQSAFGSVRTVTLTGQPAPGVPAGKVFSHFAEGLSLNNRGEATFFADFDDPRVPNDFGQGVWTEEDGALRLVARDTVAVPSGRPGEVFSQFMQDPVSNNGGQVGFVALSYIPGVQSSNRFGVYVHDGSQLRTVAREGELAPNGERIIRLEAGDPILQDSLQLAFWAITEKEPIGNQYTQGYFLYNDGELTSVANGGDASPIEGVSFASNGVSIPSLSNNGKLAFQMGLMGPDLSPDNDMATWLYSNGDIHLVAREGDLVPGAPDGVRFDGPGVGGIQVNQDGIVAIAPRLRGLEESHSWAVLKGEPGELSLVAVSNEIAPETDGALFDAFSVTLSDTGDVAFSAVLKGDGVDGSNSMGIWKEDGELLKLVARTGEIAPGTPDGAVFTSLEAEPSFNVRGQVAFFAFAAGPSFQGHGIWAQDAEGELQLIARTGATLEVAPGDVRTITEIRTNYDATSGVNGRGRDLTDLGYVSFRATFSDGSMGYFVADTVAVPEPATFASFVVYVAILAVVRLLRGR